MREDRGPGVAVVESRISLEVHAQGLDRAGSAEFGSCASLCLVSRPGLVHRTACGIKVQWLKRHAISSMFLQLFHNRVKKGHGKLHDGPCTIRDANSSARRIGLQVSPPYVK